METPEELLSFLKGLDYKLSAWELDFVESLSEQLSENRRLSPRQVDKLNEIVESLNDRQ